MAAPPTAEARLHLVGDLIDAFFQAARELATAGSRGLFPWMQGYRCCRSMRRPWAMTP